MVTAFMGLTSSRDEPNPVQPIFLPTDPIGCRRARLPLGTLMEPCRDAPVDQATAIPTISASPLRHLDRCAAAYREEYGGNEFGGLPVTDRVLQAAS